MIRIKIEPQNLEANLRSYPETYRGFSWSEAEKDFTWHRTGKLNIVHEAVDRHAEDPHKANHPALVFDKGGSIRSFTFKELKSLSCQWANLLDRHGFQMGDRLFALLPLCPELYFAMLACARIGAIFSPLFTSLSFDEIRERLLNASPRGILTHPDFVERFPPEAEREVKTLFLTEGPLPGVFPEEISVWEAIPGMQDRFETRWLPGEAPLYLLYTSGSTGPPKGVVHAHRDMVGHLATARYVLDLRSDSIFWADCEPAWVNGTVYGAWAPWLCGVTDIVQGDPFSAAGWYHTLEKHRVTIWYTAPSTIRRLMEAGNDLVRRYDLSHLDHIATVGETLLPERFFWVKEHLKRIPHDTYWMTETGMICLANFPSMAVKPGSMGRPVPGVEAAVVDEQGNPLPAMTVGELVLRPPWPAMMTAIWKDEKRYKAYFRKNGWFLTGDMVIRDDEGYYFHQGRMDDLIKIGIKLVGPYEIERALCRHPAVHEAAVIAKTFKSGEPMLMAYVRCRSGITPSNRLNHEIKAFVKASLSPDIDLTDLVFMETIPKTPSGKILRRVLRTLQMGLPVGDPAKLKDG